MKDSNLTYRGGNALFIVDAGVKGKEEIIGKTAADMPWHAQAMSIEEAERAMLTGIGGITKLRESRIVTPGKRIEAIVHRVPLFDTRGNIVGILGCYRHQSSGKPDPPLFILETIPVPAAVYDHHEGWILGNETFNDILRGLPEGERHRLFAAFGAPSDDGAIEIRYRNHEGKNHALLCQISRRNDDTLAIFINAKDFLRTEEELIKANEWLKSWVWELEIHKRKLEILHQMGFALQRCASFTEASRVIKRYLPRMFERSSGSIYVLDTARHQLKALVTYGKIKTTVTVPPEGCPAFRFGRVIGGHGEACHLCLITPFPGNMVMHCLPLMTAERPIGTINFRWEDDDERERIDQDFLLIVAEYISLTLANLQLRDQLMHQATRDALTNLYNRRYMEESLTREFYRCRRKGLPISLLFIDIDNFKDINDRYGHDAGDFVLQRMATLTVQGIRREDIACRIGGEEFVIILLETSLEAAATRAESLRRRLAISDLVYQGETIREVTVSIGVATWPIHGDDLYACLRRADAALYCAKDHGRNRIAIAAPVEAVSTPTEVSSLDRN